MEHRSYTYVRIFLIVLCSVPSKAPGHIPASPGFYMVSNLPAVGRGETNFIYAIKGDGQDGKIEVTKNGGLASSVINQGALSPFGCSLSIVKPNRFPGSRFGQYTATFSPADGSADITGYAFVRPRSKLLDTRGVYTVTIYPEAEGSSSLASPESIGVAWTPGCNKYIWCKDRQRDINRGHRFDLKNTEDAGLYTISRPGRGKRGWSVQILVIAATCPEGWYFDTDDNACVDMFDYCANGGVLKDRSSDPECVCPPLFSDDRCDCSVIDSEGDTSRPDFELAEGYPAVLLCGDLPGGNARCEGHLFCYGDNYGCKCASGWSGTACNRPCPKGRWGADCEQRCPNEERDCSRFFGPDPQLCLT